MNSAEERIRWVLQFVRMNLDNLRPGDWLNLEEDMRAFLGEHVRVLQQGRNLEALREAKKFADDLLHKVAVQHSPKYQVGLEHITDLTIDAQRRNWIESSGTTGKKRLRLFTLNPRDLDTLSFVSASGQPDIAVTVPTLLVGFKFALGQVLTQDLRTPSAQKRKRGVADRLRLCPGPNCGTPFFAEHGRQQFCSAKCKGKAASQRFRTRHREELSERAHGHYRQKTEAKSQGKVQRRKRTNRKEV